MLHLMEGSQNYFENKIVTAYKQHLEFWVIFIEKQILSHFLITGKNLLLISQTISFNQFTKILWYLRLLNTITEFFWKKFENNLHVKELYWNKNVVTFSDGEVDRHWTEWLLKGWNSRTVQIALIMPKWRQHCLIKKRFTYLKSEAVHS